MIILSLVVLILFMGPANASSYLDDHNDTLTVSNEIEIVDDNNENLDNGNADMLGASSQEKLGSEIEFSGTTVSELITQIRSAAAGDTIILTNDLTATSNEASFSKSITIDGDNHIIDANGNTVFYNSQSGLHVVFKNIKFINGKKTDYGVFRCFYSQYDFINCTFENSGPLRFLESANGQIINCTFKNCAGSYGGAINFQGGNNFTIKNCYFENCSARNGAIIYTGLSSSRTYCTNMVVDNCTFVNSTNLQFGAIGNNFYGNVSNCTFKNITAYMTVVEINDGNVYNCTFMDNNQTASGVNGYGVLCIYNSNVTKCNFTNNCRLTLGLTNGNCNISNCSFENNAGYDLYNYDSYANVSNCTFNSQSKYEIYNNHHMFLENNTVSKNILNNGMISSKTYMIALNNQTVIQAKGYQRILNGTIKDDVGNTIEVGASIIGFYGHCDYTFTMTKAGTQVYTYRVDSGNVASQYDNDAGIFYSPGYTFNDVGAYTVTPSFKNANANQGFSDTDILTGVLLVQGDAGMSVTHNNTIYVGENATVKVTLNDAARGNITITVGDKNKTFVLSDTLHDTVEWNVADLPEGTYKVIVNYTGDSVYAAQNYEGDLVVKNYYDVDVVVVPGYPGDNSTVIVTVPVDVSGVVSVDINGTVYPTVKVNDSTYVVNVTLPAGNYSASASVSDDPKYDDKTSDEVPFEVVKVDDYPIGVDVVPGNPGENTTVTVTVPEDVTGDVTVVIDGVDYPVVPINGTVILDVPLPAGNHTVEVKVEDDPKYDDKTSDEVPFEVVKVDDYPIGVDVVPGNPGENTTVTVHVPSDVTGNVTIIVDDVEYPVTPVNGTATIELPLDAGNHTTSAKVSDDPKYTDNVSDDVPFEIKKVDDYSINVDVNPGKSGENTTVTVHVPSDVTGNVTIIVDDVEYPVTPVNGTAILELPLDAGNHSASASVSDDPKYDDKTSDEVPFEVVKVDDYPIGVDVVPGNPGENTTVTVHVPTDVAGNVTIIVDDIEYPVTPVNGTATIELPLGSGNHTAIANITKDPKYADKQSNITEFSIAKSNDIEIIVTVNPDHVNYGDAVEYIITVINHGPDDATGVIANIAISKDFEYISNNLSSNYNEIKDLLMSSSDKQSFDESTGIWNIGDLANGETVKLAILLKAKYIGVRDVNGTVKGDNIETNMSDNNDSAPVTVTKVSDYPIDVKVTPGKPDENTSVTVIVPEDVTGDVTVVIDGVDYPVTPINGTVILDVPLPAGNHTINVKVSDDPKYDDNETEKVPFEVKKDDDYSIDVKVDPGKAGEKTKITVSVPSDADGDVSIIVDGKKYHVTPENGTATLEIPLKAGDHTVRAELTDDSKYSDKTSDDIKFTIKKTNDYDIDVDVKPGKNGETIITVHVPSDADGEVTVIVDGKEYKVTPIDGVAVLKLNLGSGNHKVSVKLTGDSKYEDKEVYTSFDIPKSEKQNNTSKHASENIVDNHSLAKYPTGNPIFALLLVLFALAGINLRRFKK